MKPESPSKKVKRQAYKEAAALLETDCSSADLQCEYMSNFTVHEAEQVREFMRQTIVGILQSMSKRHL